MQNKTVLFGLGAVVVLGIGVGIWVIGMSPASTDEERTENQQTQSTSMRALLASNAPQRCTFSYSEAESDSNSSGEIFVSNGQMRGNFNSQANGQTVESHLIVKDDVSYVWSDAFPTGFKTSLDAMSRAESQEGSVDPDRPLDYSCSSWRTDASVFALPSDIEFQDMSATLDASQQMNAGASQCAACDQAPDANTRAQCRAAMQCN